ncbi:type I methionyl aminopeptidase [Halovulum sp. GXIMD14793]
MDGPGTTRLNSDGIRIHAPEDFAGMHKAGQLAASILDMIADHVAPGVTTGELDQRIEDAVDAAGAVSATIGYKGYKHASCISVNHVVCHGIPGSPIPRWKKETNALRDDPMRDDDRLLDGDILNIDVTVIVDGWFGDTSRMYVAGKPKPYAHRLIQATHDALMKGIEAVRPGNTFNDIALAIQTFAEAQRYSVVRDFCGHGLGRVFHAAPNVVHCVQPGPSPVFEPGMFFTIEPMINMGTYRTKPLKDGWTAVTQDKALSAQFEHSVGVTETGVEIFTLSPGDRYHPTWG